MLFEDDQLLVVDKPAGLPTLAGAGPGLAGENNAMAVMNRVGRVSPSTGRIGETSGTTIDECSGETDGGSNQEQAALFAVNRIDKPVSGRVW